MEGRSEECNVIALSVPLRARYFDWGRIVGLPNSVHLAQLGLRRAAGASSIPLQRSSRPWLREAAMDLREFWRLALLLLE